VKLVRGWSDGLEVNCILVIKRSMPNACIASSPKRKGWDGPTFARGHSRGCLRGHSRGRLRERREERGEREGRGRGGERERTTNRHHANTSKNKDTKNIQRQAGKVVILNVTISY